MCVQHDKGLPALFALVVQNTSLVVCLRLSFRDAASTYAPSTVVLCSELLKLIVCSLVVARRCGKDLRLVLVQIGNQHMLFIPSMLYVVQNNLLFFGAERLSSLVYILCSQSKILTTAIMSRIILGTKLSRVQCMYLSLLAVGLVLVQARGDESNPQTGHEQASSVLGITAVILAAWSSGTAGVVLERIYKAVGQPDDAIVHTIWTRNVQLSFISLPFAIFGVFLQNHDQAFTSGFFKGYGVLVWLIILLQTAGGVIIAYVMKFTNNILKCLAIGLSICCCAVYSFVVGELELTANVMLGIFLVCVSIAGYSLHSTQGTDKSLPSSQNVSVTVQGKEDAP